MTHIEQLEALTIGAEDVLRQRAVAREQDADASVRQMQDALANRRVQAACLFDAEEMACGFAAWRTQSANDTQLRAQVVMLYTLSGSPAQHGAALVEHVFNALVRLPDLAMIEVRMRDDVPGARETWSAYGLAFFERCRLTRTLTAAVPLPVLPLLPQYTLTPWDARFGSAVEKVAHYAHEKGMEAVMLPDVRPDAPIHRLRELQAGHLSGVGDWYPEASLVALYKGRVVGYLAAAWVDDHVHIADHAVIPAQRRRGVGQALMARALALALQYRAPLMTVDLAKDNPALPLYTRLGFHATQRGEVGVWWRDDRQSAWRK